MLTRFGSLASTADVVPRTAAEQTRLAPELLSLCSGDLTVPTAFNDEIRVNLSTLEPADNLHLYAAELARNDNDKKIDALVADPRNGPGALADLRELTAELSRDPAATTDQFERLMMRTHAVVDSNNAGRHDARDIAVRLADRLQRHEHRFSPLARWAVAESLYKILRSSTSLCDNDTVLQAAARGIAQGGVSDGVLAAELMRKALPILRNEQDVARAGALAVTLSEAFIRQPALLAVPEARLVHELIAGLADNVQLDETDRARLFVFILHEHNSAQRFLPLQDIHRCAEALYMFAVAAPAEQRVELSRRVAALSRMALNTFPRD